MPDRPSRGPSRLRADAAGRDQPTPVTTTRRLTNLRLRPCGPADYFLTCFSMYSMASLTVDLLGVLVGDLDPERLFEGHHELDRVEGVGAEVVHEGSLADFLGVDAQLLDDDARTFSSTFISIRLLTATCTCRR